MYRSYDLTSSLCILFLMKRQPPRSPLFPYSTLIRSQAEDGIRDWSVTGVQTDAVFCLRSEEQTPELQSLTKLRCRPVIETKQGSHWARDTKMNASPLAHQDRTVIPHSRTHVP